MTVQRHIKTHLKAGGLSTRQALAVIWIARAEPLEAPGRWWSRDVEQAGEWLPQLCGQIEQLAARYRAAFHPHTQH